MRKKSWLFLLLLAFSCEDGPPPNKTLDEFLPPLPTPTGEPQTVFAGKISDPASPELIDGPARSGLMNDFYMRNSRARFVIQSETRAIGVVPWGGNVVDAVPLANDGGDLGEDHLGEVSMVYLLGRTCAHDRVEVLLDGSGGGPAVIRATGHSAPNDYVNLRGIGLLPIPQELDPDIEDGVTCATTYTLWPDATKLEIAWTLFNGGEYDLAGPFGAINDTGGAVESFSPGLLGFNRAGIDALANLGEPQPANYAVYQGPGVAYGIVPVHAAAGTPNATFLVAGVSIVIFGADQLFDILNEENGPFYLHLAVNDGVTNRLDLVVGTDAADVEEQFRAGTQTAVTEVSGTVAYAPSGLPGARARVGLVSDTNGDGALDPDDQVATYFDADDTGAFSGKVPAGTYFVRADVKDLARSAVSTITVAATPVDAGALELAEPARFDFSVVDDVTGEPIPAKLQVLGRHPAAPDNRVHEVYDRREGILRVLHSVYGTSMPAAPTDPADPAIELPAGGPYKIYASHGPEWTVASTVVTATAGQTGTLEFRLRRVVDTTGYVACEFHQHALGSPDSPVPFDDRLKSLAVEGIEFFASTDHDYVSDYDPYIDQFGLRPWIDSIPGIEATPFAYGHFNAWPLALMSDDPTGGAIDWAVGATQGFAMLPGELWDALRTRGAQVVEVNHPRATSNAFASFQSYFDRAGLVFDFAGHTFFGDVNEQPVPADWLRLPDATKVFSDTFDALEVWNGFRTIDSDYDGVKEIRSLDMVMRDWMNFLSFGKLVAPIGNSDSHTREKDPAGMPRTYIRVADDSSVGIMNGVDGEVMASILGTGGAPQDLVVSNGPMLAVSADGGATSAIGRVITVTGGTATLEITATAADWVQFDTIELFANSTFDPIDDDLTVLQPFVCFTSREPATIMAQDPCALAVGGARAMTVQEVAIGGGAKRMEATVTIDVSAAEVPRREGATGDDVWVVVRVRGQKAVFPVLIEGAITDANLDTIVSGTEAEIDAALTGTGVPAAAFTAPILLDVDGGGWKGQFQP